MEEVVANDIDIGAVIIETINSLCESLFSSIDDAILPHLDELTFISTDITKTDYLTRLLGTNAKTGLLVLANALLTAFVLYYAVRRFTSFYSGNEVESPYVFVLKAIFIAILMNFSLTICNYVISLTHDITQFITGLGLNAIGKETTFSALLNSLNSSISGQFNIFSLDGILTGMLSFSSFGMIISFALRYIMIKILVLLSPFAFLCLLNKTTVGLFKSWYKSFASLLLVQILISLILLLSLAIAKESVSTVFNKLLIVGAISALLKSGEYIKEFIGGIGITTNFQSGISGLRSLLMR